MMTRRLQVISLGAGVQSSVMALMAANGELPRPDCAIFADTQWEPQGVYDHLDWLEKQLPFKVFRVTKGNIRSSSVEQGFSEIPFFGLENGKKTIGRRQCTNDYKIQPIRKKLRKLLGLKKGERAKGHSAVAWIGISTDEAVRMKPSRDAWIQNIWPLIEKGMSRQDCLAWFKKRYPTRPLAKSACIGCPFHNDKEWRDMKINDPKSFADAIIFDNEIRNSGSSGTEQFLHASRQPLSEVDLRNLEDKGQINMFENECEGMCGV